MALEARRERERQELKQAILSAALKTAAEEGWQKVTVRKIAELIEYSPPIIYGYFENKEAVLLELRREGFTKKLAYLQAAYNKVNQAKPEQIVIELARAYFRFACENPPLYQLMYEVGITFPVAEVTQAEQEILRLCLKILQSLFPLKDEAELDKILTIMVTVMHGFTVTYLTGHGHQEMHTSLALLEDTIEALIKAWTN
jgi:AcrR family transcriptional regulator